MTINGVNGAAALYRYVSGGGSAGGATFAETLSAAEESAKSDEEILCETLEEIYLNNQRKNSEEKQEKKDFWELRTERQKLLDEYFQLREIQRKAFEETALKRKAAKEYFFSGEGMLFFHSAAEEIFGGLA
ncbi:MAG: hypothetical protein NC395_10130 [Prevotella sp.]|nr:hypothetical protein [Prevotella sp.]